MVDAGFFTSSGGALKYTADELRQILGPIFGTGGLIDAKQCVPTLVNSLQVSLSTGVGLIPGTNIGDPDAAGMTAQGYYIAPFTGASTVDLDPETVPSGQARIDQIICEVVDLNYAGADRIAQFRALKGTPAASPVPADMPKSAIKVCAARVTSTGTTLLTSTAYRDLNRPRGLDGVFIPLGVATDQVLTVPGPKRFTKLARGASGPLRGYNKLSAHRSTTWQLPAQNVAAGNWTLYGFDTVDSFISDDGLGYSAGVIHLDGPYAISGEVSLKAPAGYGGVRLRTGGGTVVYQLVLSASNNPFDYLSLPFHWTWDYHGDLMVEVIQQSSGTQTQPANANANPCRLDVLGVA